jgi:hypothetical protein
VNRWNLLHVQLLGDLLQRHPRNAKPAEWPSFAVEELGTWAHRLGNHCLLKKSENGAIGNKPWTAKKPVLARSSLKLTSEAGASVNWDKEAIAKR